jgi:HK97 family phage prohead protease
LAQHDMSTHNYLHIRVIKVGVDDLADRFDGKGLIYGKASVSGNVDSYGDIVVPGAFADTIAKNNGTFPLLYQHDVEQVLGLVVVREGVGALYCEGKLNLELPIARDVFSNLRFGALTGLSIGYSAEDIGWDKAGHRLLKRVRLMEVSIVTFPANELARVSDVKAADAAGDAAFAAGLRHLAIGMRASLIAARAANAKKAAQKPAPPLTGRAFADAQRARMAAFAQQLVNDRNTR